MKLHVFDQRLSCVRYLSFAPMIFCAIIGHLLFTALHPVCLHQIQPLLRLPIFSMCKLPVLPQLSWLCHFLSLGLSDSGSLQKCAGHWHMHKPGMMRELTLRGKSGPLGCRSWWINVPSSVLQGVSIRHIPFAPQRVPGGSNPNRLCNPA